MKTLAALLFFVSAAFSGTVTISGDTKVLPYKIVKLTADGADPKAGIIWRISPSKDVSKATSSQKSRLEFVAPPGNYTVDLLSVRLSATGETQIDEAQVTVTIGEPTPPSPPVPPVPPPSPAPIPLPGFRALFIYESAELGKMSAQQQLVLTSQTIRDYLSSKCVAGPDGRTKEWRFYDKDTDLSADGKVWQDAMKRPRTQVPWLIVSNGKEGYEGPLPENEAKTLELLKKYGG